MVGCEAALPCCLSPGGLTLFPFFHVLSDDIMRVLYGLVSVQSSRWRVLYCFDVGRWQDRAVLPGFRPGPYWRVAEASGM